MLNQLDYNACLVEMMGEKKYFHFRLKLKFWDTYWITLKELLYIMQSYQHNSQL